VGYYRLRIFREKFALWTSVAGPQRQTKNRGPKAAYLYLASAAPELVSIDSISGVNLLGISAA
jgi:hypothetical protein